MKIHNLSSEDPVIQLEHRCGYKDTNAKYRRTLYKGFTDTLCVQKTFSTFLPSADVHTKR